MYGYQRDMGVKTDDSHHPAEDDSIWDFLNMAWPSNPVV
jgi:hypothetical protein